MAKSHKHVASLYRFLERAPVEAIRSLLTQTSGAEHATAFEALDWDTLEGDAGRAALPQTLLDACAGLGNAPLSDLEAHARRILLLSENKGPDAVRVAIDKLYLNDPDGSIRDAFGQQLDDYGRATLLFIKSPTVFEEAEKFVFAEHYRNYGKLYEAFDLDCDNSVEFEWSDALRLRLQEKLTERLGIVGGCVIEHLPFEQTEADGQVHTAHLLLVRYKGDKDTRLDFVERELIRRIGERLYGQPQGDHDE